MYHGLISKTVPFYSERYTPGIGTISYRAGITQREYHRYQCERCGATFDVLGVANEPFFCGKCNTLIGISPTEPVNAKG